MVFAPGTLYTKIGHLEITESERLLDIVNENRRQGTRA